MNKSSFICIGVSLFAFMLAFPLPTFCQQSNQAAPRMLYSSAHTNASCELATVFTGLAIELKNSPDANGYIVIYSGPNDPPGLLHRHSLGTRNVLVNEQHISPDRIIIMNGGSRETFSAEYWLVPKHTPPPQSGPVWKPELQQVEFGRFDEFFWGTGPEDLFEYRRESTRLDGFAQALIKNPDAAGYIIAYADGEKVTQTYLENKNGKERAIERRFRMTGKKLAGWAKNSLVELLKVNPSRIVTIDGGYREFETVELWIVPAGENAPKPTPTVKR